MAQDLPASEPQWDSTNANSTEPTTQKTVGWAAGVPKRQYDSWHKQWTWRWLKWFKETIFRDDLREDQPIAGLGTAPSVGAGGTAAANEFSAAAIIGGYRREITTGPTAIHNYAGVGSGGRDTYWSLSRGGVWTATDVAPGAGEPALPANSVFVYAVEVDNAGVKSLLKDYRPTRGRLTKALDAMDLRAVTRSTALGVESSGAELIAPLRRLLIDKTGITGGHFRNQVVWQSDATDGTDSWQLVCFGAEGDDTRWILARGARVTTADGALGGTWTADVANIERFTYESSNGAISRQSKTGLVPGATLTEADWYTQSSTETREFLLNGHLVLGDATNTSAGTVNIRNLLRFVRGLSGALAWTDLIGDITGSAWRIYTGAGMLGEDSCFALVHNAKWIHGSTHWERIDNAKDAFIVYASHSTFLVATHPSTSGNTWANTLEFGNTTWRKRFIVNALSSAAESVTVQSLRPTEAFSLAIDPNTLYQYNITKAWAYIQTDNAGSILFAEYYNCSATVVAGAPGYIDVTLDNALVSTGAGVQASAEQDIDPALGLKICQWEIIGPTTIRLYPCTVASASGVVTRQDPNTEIVKLALTLHGIM